MNFPELKFNPRDREYLSYQEPLRDKVIYEYLFNGKSRRWLDDNILGLDPEYSRGWQSFGILSFVGLTDEHKGIFKGMSLDESIDFLADKNDKLYAPITTALKRLTSTPEIQPNSMLDLFTPSPDAKKLFKLVGKSQYTDGVRIDKEFHNVFNPPGSPLYVGRGKARSIKILFNNKVFPAEYRFEDQKDKNIVLQSIRFRKALKVEFKKVFPVPTGEFFIQNGIDLNHFVFNHLAISFDDEGEEDIGYPEGKIAFRMHRIIERDPRVIKKAKDTFAKINGGRLFCEACGFDYFIVYGPRGNDFIEGHHKKKVSEMREGAETKVEDINLLCANCHRMIHRKPFINLEQLSILINNRN
ncbi:HNH endonuclease [Pelotomaculum propionicicum]|uniref:HNH endonuclease n=1 Tax=Pelotomaculum propionicicum TaxID=258475 RepID=UPI003B7F2B98